MSKFDKTPIDRRAVLRKISVAAAETLPIYFYLSSKSRGSEYNLTSYKDALEAARSLFAQTLTAVIDGHIIKWSRNAHGPCLGGGWIPSGNITIQHFDMSHGVSNALKEAISFASENGGKLFILKGRYLIDAGVSVRIRGHLFIEFESDAKLVAADGLSKSVIYIRGAGDDQISCSDQNLTIINPQIDCSSGTSPRGMGKGFCTAISFSYLKNGKIVGGMLYGGDNPRNDNADSGISWVTCCRVDIDNVQIEGFNDCGIYPGGNNMKGTPGDGGTGTITGCLIRKCNSAVAAKREMTLLVFDSNTVEDCLSGVSSQDVKSGGGVQGGRRIEIVNNSFRRCLSNVIRPRGATGGIAKNNQIIDFGYDPITLKSAKKKAVAINLDGTTGFELSNNTLRLHEWKADSQLAMLFSRHKFLDQTYDHGYCFGSENSYQNIPRIIEFSTPGGPHNFTSEHFINTGRAPINSKNANKETIITYFKDGATKLKVWRGISAAP